MTTSKDLSFIRPFELQPGRSPWFNRWPTDEVWSLFQEARTGNVTAVKSLLQRDPTLVQASYWYKSPLRIAAIEGHKAVVAEILKYESLLGGSPCDDRVAVAQAAIDRGHADVAKFLVDKKFSLTTHDHDIHQAVRASDTDLVKNILSRDETSINRTGARGKTPLHYAVENEDLGMVQLLVERGARVDRKAYSSDDRLGTYGFRPVASALWYHGFWRQRNHYEIVNFLISQRSAYTLPIAAACGDLKRVDMLLKQHKKDPDYAEPCGKRALSAAAERNHVEIVDLLLHHGAHPNLAEGPYCPNGYALWAAARFEHKEVVDLLLKQGADPNAQVDSSGSPIEATRDPTIRAVLGRHGGQISMVSHFFNKNIEHVKKILNKHRDSLSETDVAFGFAAAVSNSDRDLLQLLLDRGFKVPTTVTFCQTYLWMDLKLVELLLRSGMDPNLPNWQLMTPLHHMAGQGNIDAAKLFLKYGANPVLVDAEYRSTPLGWAAREGQIDFVKFLLSYDSHLKYVHPAQEDERFTTPLQWAYKRGHQDIVDLLE